MLRLLQQAKCRVSRSNVESEIKSTPKISRSFPIEKRKLVMEVKKLYGKNKNKIKEDDSGIRVDPQQGIRRCILFHLGFESVLL